MTAILRLLAAGTLAASSAITLDARLGGRDSATEAPLRPASAIDLPPVDLGILMAEPILIATKTKPPFSQSRRQPGSDTALRSVSQPISKLDNASEEDVVLHGVFVAGSRRSALVSLGGDNRFWLSEGDQKSGIELLSVQPKSALVRQGGRRIRLRIDGPGSPGKQPAEGLRS
ncbi:MAG: hypothetical protein AAF557_22870 [Pseudomonadota bacterium]